ncbi:GFA family protein [Marinobacter confluentis]|uniref:GFA family protein n=1 Tax=Marinobacter confluentis TaxID=1697557 RepID=A0A4Z1BZS7_9GAMM|nr:GFA family protein [Marinobacter confluentis]
MKGSCLCGDVRFEVSLERLGMFQCHCQLCRKQAGTASSCGAIVETCDFHWLSGESRIGKWEKESGFSSHFCKRCGSSVPNQFRDSGLYWIPVGLLDDSTMVTVANLFVDEKVSWSNVDSSVNPHQTKPRVDSLIRSVLKENH